MFNIIVMFNVNSCVMFYCFMGTELQFYKKKNVLVVDGGDGGTV